MEKSKKLAELVVNNIAQYFGFYIHPDEWEKVCKEEINKAYKLIYGNKDEKNSH